jgi:undecaprenyl-diphosphatase
VTLPATILLGIIQGLTEFLPVSSSAHLILARFFFGWETPPELGLAFDVAIHLGTLAAILAYFRAELSAMARSLSAVFSADPGDAGRLIRLICVGTIPVVVVGLLFSDVIEQRLRTPGVAAAALAVGAVAMIAAERFGPRTRGETSLRWSDALIIGCAQAAALVPGVSRSGSTIALGMFLGMRRDAAARFTFLLAIPATLAAAAKEGLELRHLALADQTVVLFAVGILVSGVVGYLTIKYFLRFLGGHRLDVFAYYRLLLAAATVVWLWRY